MKTNRKHVRSGSGTEGVLCYVYLLFRGTVAVLRGSTEEFDEGYLQKVACLWDDGADSRPPGPARASPAVQPGLWKAVLLPACMRL